MIKNVFEHDQAILPNPISNKGKRLAISVSVIFSGDFIKNLWWQQLFQK